MPVFSELDSGWFATVYSLNTVSEWVRGIRPNHGFVITPDRKSVMEFYNATAEGGYLRDIVISRFELVVTVAKPEP